MELFVFDKKPGPLFTPRSTNAPLPQNSFVMLEGLRWMVGIALLAGGLTQGYNVTAFLEVVRNFRLLLPEMVSLAAVGIILVQLRAAELLLSGRDVQQGAAFASCFYLATTVLMFFASVRGSYIPNVGLFGDYFRMPLSASSISQSAGLLLLSSILYGLAQKFCQRPEKNS